MGEAMRNDEFDLSNAMNILGNADAIFKSDMEQGNAKNKKELRIMTNYNQSMVTIRESYTYKLAHEKHKKPSLVQPALQSLMTLQTITNKSQQQKHNSDITKKDEKLISPAQQLKLQALT